MPNNIPKAVKTDRAVIAFLIKIKRNLAKNNYTCVNAASV